MNPLLVQMLYVGLAAVACLTVYLHLGTKYADKLDAEAALATTNHHAALVEHGTAALLRAFETYASNNLSGIQDLQDPARRAVALRALEGAAKVSADPLLKTAYDTLGPAWLQPVAHKLIDDKLAAGA